MNKPTTLNVTPPGDIDADPVEVGGLAAEQIATVSDELRELVEASAVQIRSSWMSGRLCEDDELNPARLRREWECSQTYALVERIKGAAGTLSELAQRVGSDV